MTATVSRISNLSLTVGVAAAAMSLAGCVVPRAGPSMKDFNHASAAQSINLVEATMQDAAATHDAPTIPTGFDPAWQSAPPSLGGVIGPGDILSVSFFERDGLNLFSTASDGNSRIDGLKVDPSGVVQLPYAGDVHVGGLTPAEARRAIISRLSRLTFGTDVTVTVTEQHSRLVSVQGDVSKPGVVPIGPESNRLLSVLGTAAPTPADLELATVTVRRGGQSSTMRLSSLYDQPQDDIALQPGDVVIVRGIVGTVNVLGAAGLQGRVKITRHDYSLMDAIADARGLDNAAADPAAIYVMRAADMAATSGLPRVYHFDMRNPAQLAVANAFMLHNGDAVLISNASFAQYQKVLSTFSGIVNSSRAVTTIP